MKRYKNVLFARVFLSFSSVDLRFALETMDLESVLKKLGVIDRKIKQVIKQKKTAETLAAVLLKVRSLLFL